MIACERSIHPETIRRRSIGCRQKKANEVGKDRRRKHHHWRVTVYYGDGETFARVYIDLEIARRFAQRQKKSRVVKKTRVARIS
jgi:predicted DNA binding protein